MITTPALHQLLRFRICVSVLSCAVRGGGGELAHPLTDSKQGQDIADLTLYLLHEKLFTFFCLLQHLEARNKGRVGTMPSRDSRPGLDVAYLSALTTSAKLAEEEQRIKNHFLSQTMSLKVSVVDLCHECSVEWCLMA